VVGGVDHVRLLVEEALLAGLDFGFAHTAFHLVALLLIVLGGGFVAGVERVFLLFDDRLVLTGLDSLA